MDDYATLLQDHVTLKCRSLESNLAASLRDGTAFQELIERNGQTVLRDHSAPSVHRSH